MHTYTYIYTYIYIYVYMCMCICTYICIYVHVYVHIHGHILHISTYLHICMYSFSQSCSWPSAEVTTRDVGRRQSKTGPNDKQSEEREREREGTTTTKRIQHARAHLTPGVDVPAARLTTSILPPDGLKNRAGRTQHANPRPKVSKYSQEKEVSSVSVYL